MFEWVELLALDELELESLPLAASVSACCIIKQLKTGENILDGGWYSIWIYLIACITLLLLLEPLSHSDKSSSVTDN